MGQKRESDIIDFTIGSAVQKARSPRRTGKAPRERTEPEPTQVKRRIQNMEDNYADRKISASSFSHLFLHYEANSAGFT